MSLVIALGSNLGDKLNNLESAVSHLSTIFGSPIEKSRVYHSKAVGVENQPDFYNMVLSFKSPNMSPQEVLSACLAAEESMGRKRVFKWGPRNIDIDILFIDNIIVDDANLTIPHPFINERSFVLFPLFELRCHIELKKWFNFCRVIDENCLPIEL